MITLWVSGFSPEAAAIIARICIVMKKLICAGSISISVPQPNTGDLSDHTQ